MFDFSFIFMWVPVDHEADVALLSVGAKRGDKRTARTRWAFLKHLPPGLLSAIYGQSGEHGSAGTTMTPCDQGRGEDKGNGDGAGNGGVTTKEALVVPVPPGFEGSFRTRPEVQPVGQRGGLACDMKVKVAFDGRGAGPNADESSVEREWTKDRDVRGRGDNTNRVTKEEEREAADVMQTNRGGCVTGGLHAAIELGALERRDRVDGEQEGQDKEMQMGEEAEKMESDEEAEQNESDEEAGRTESDEEAEQTESDEEAEQTETDEEYDSDTDVGDDSPVYSSSSDNCSLSSWEKEKEAAKEGHAMTYHDSAAATATASATHAGCTVGTRDRARDTEGKLDAGLSSRDLEEIRLAFRDGQEIERDLLNLAEELKRKKGEGGDMESNECNAHGGCGVLDCPPGVVEGKLPEYHYSENADEPGHDNDRKRSELALSYEATLAASQGFPLEGFQLQDFPLHEVPRQGLRLHDVVLEEFARQEQRELDLAGVDVEQDQGEHALGSFPDTDGEEVVVEPQLHSPFTASTTPSGSQESMFPPPPPPPPQSRVTSISNQDPDHVTMGSLDGEKTDDEFVEPMMAVTLSAVPANMVEEVDIRASCAGGSDVVSSGGGGCCSVLGEVEGGSGWGVFCRNDVREGETIYQENALLNVSLEQLEDSTAWNAITTAVKQVMPLEVTASCMYYGLRRATR